MYDPWQEANEAFQTYIAKINLEAYPVVLEKGVRGGIPFDSNYHEEKDRKTMVHITLTPLPSSNRDEPFEYWYLTFDKRWSAILKPSIQAAGFPDVRMINDYYVTYQTVPTGKWYPASTGEMKEETAPKVVAHHGNTLADAEAVASQRYGGGNGDTQTPQATQAVNVNAQQQTAYNFLRYYVTQSGGDLDKVSKSIETNGILKEFYWDNENNTANLGHPDVVKLLSELQPEKPF